MVNFAPRNGHRDDNGEDNNYKTVNIHRNSFKRVKVTLTAHKENIPLVLASIARAKNRFDEVVVRLGRVLSSVLRILVDVVNDRLLVLDKNGHFL
jgi:hypothetical protein